MRPTRETSSSAKTMLWIVLWVSNTSSLLHNSSLSGRPESRGRQLAERRDWGCSAVQVTHRDPPPGAPAFVYVPRLSNLFDYLINTKKSVVSECVCADVYVGVCCAHLCACVCVCVCACVRWQGPHSNIFQSAPRDDSNIYIYIYIRDISHVLHLLIKDNHMVCVVAGFQREPNSKKNAYLRIVNSSHT